LPLDRIGREGFLKLEFVRRRDHTILTRRRCTHPLQALAPFRGPDGSLCMMMLNPSGGMVGGDMLRAEIDIGENAAAVLITASAAKVYRTVGPAAVQETTIRLGSGAAIEYIPDHLIPHPGAVCHQSLRVEMAPGSRAIIYDAIAAGRVGRGESWRFKELRSEIVIMRGSRPLYINRSRIVPARLHPAQRGLAENFNYLATVIVADDTRSDWPDLVSEFDDALNGAPGSIGGASALGSGGCVARLMSNAASDQTRLVNELWRIARRRLLKLEPFSVRKF
jgi:urease accessory protein